MSCQGESKRIDGRYLKNVIVNKAHTVTVTKEEYVEIQGKIEAMTSRTTLRCPASSGGCVGAENMFVWRQDTNSCDVKKVRKITGFLDKEAGIFTSTSTLATFNITHGLKTLSSS